MARKPKTKQTASQLLQELELMPLERRINAVAKDVRTRADRFACIEPHDLANVLEVEQPERPTGEWEIVTYAYKETLEQYAKHDWPVSEYVYHLEGKVSKQRFDELKKQFERLNKRPSFAFLTRAERRDIEAAKGAEDVENNMSNGMCGLARYCVEHGKTKLWFEGHLEDDGHCSTLLTPYDKRDGKFLDLSKCVTKEWW